LYQDEARRIELMSALEMTTHSPTFSTTTQLLPADLATLAAQGVRGVINSRPDGEGGAEQPVSATLQAAAEQAGITYAYLPVVPSEINDEVVKKFATLLAVMPKPIVAFCKTGGRAAKLYRLATAMDHEPRG
jgi:sulfide:quinone oxidoreductase